MLITERVPLFTKYRGKVTFFTSTKALKEAPTDRSGLT